MFELTRWIANLAFAGLVSTAYVCFALVFRQMGGEIRWNTSYLIAMLSHPLFLSGLALSFSSTFVRLVLFQKVGISRTVLLSELSVVMMLVMSLAIFREEFGLREIMGSILILTGIMLVGR